MSNYRATAIHPVTGKNEYADFLDNYFGHHIYGVRFAGEDRVYPIDQVEIPAELGIEEVDSVSLFSRMWRDQDMKLKVSDTMKQYGGSFVQSLAECTLRADKDNLRKLVTSFFEYYKKYAEWGK